MRKFSANTYALANLREVELFYLVEVHLQNGDVFRETNLATSVTIPGLGTYEASSGLQVFEGVRQSSAVDRETYKVAYVDPVFRLRDAFEEGLTGSKLVTRIGLFNSSGAVMTSGGLPVNPGEPLLGAEDILIAYSGWIDTQGYAIDPDQGTVVAVVEGSSPMASLDQTRSFYSTREAMRQINPNDNSFDQVYTGVSKVSYSWGKAPNGSGN